MADDPSKHDDPQGTEGTEGGGAGTPAPQDNGTQQAQTDDLKDKHGEDAINLGHHNRLMAEKDAEIAKLAKQVEDLTGKADKGADALKRIGELEARLEDEKVTSALKVAGCVNEKAAKAVLGDYEGDVAKLREACPYLFGGETASRQKGSTGARPGGASQGDEWIDKAFGIKK